MLKVLRQYPAASLTGAIAVAGGISRLGLHLLDRRDASRHASVSELIKQAMKVELSDNPDQLRRTAHTLAGAAMRADHNWRHVHGWTTFDGWASAKSTGDAAHELEQAANATKKFIDDEIKEVLASAVAICNDWGHKEPILLSSEKEWKAAEEYVEKLEAAPRAKEIRAFGDIKPFHERLKKAKAAVEALEVPQLEPRDPEWTHWLLAIGLVCFAAGLTRDLRK